MASPDNTPSPQASSPATKTVSGRRIVLYLVILTLMMMVAAFFIARTMLPEAKEYHQKRPSLPPPAL